MLGSQIRPLNVRTDLMMVADLIEGCFALQDDPEGQSYLRSLRQYARDAVLIHFLGSLGTDQPYLSMEGLVWEDEGKVVGNLSLIPILYKKKQAYMIANVAVHPQYRQQGIGHSLTRQAIDLVKAKSGKTIWLQVREDNPVAIHLYETLGFQQQCSISTWHFVQSATRLGTIISTCHVRRRQASDWQLHKKWLRQCLNDDLTWNLPFSERGFQPGVFNWLRNLLNDGVMRHYTVDVDGRLGGVISWQPTTGYADLLWVACDMAKHEAVIGFGLPQVVKRIYTSKPLVVHFKDANAAEVFQLAGFAFQRTLVHMRLDL